MKNGSVDTSIQHRLMRVMLITCGATLLLTCAAYFGYEYFNFKRTYLSQLSNLGKIIASNTTGALTFDSREDAAEVLGSLKANPYVTGASLYDKSGNLFAKYPANLITDTLLIAEYKAGYQINNSQFEGYEPVMLDDKHLGTLFITTNMNALYEVLTFFSVIALIVLLLSFLFAYILSRRMQKGITQPILTLAEISQSVSKNHDYSVRAGKYNNDEVGMLTDAFNQMLSQIETQNHQITSFNQQLEQKISERTIQLEAANKELEAFSYSVSHDLRAPLRAVGGYARMLEEDNEDLFKGDAKRLLGEIQRNAKRMGNLIDDLLSFARLGRKEVAKTNVDVRDLVENALQEINSTGENKADIKIGELIPVMADRALMQHVVTNLLSNAVKYSSKKERPVVEIKSVRKNGQVIYSVSDNGAGFDMKYASKLFGVFQRLHTNEEFTGTGVGLAIVQRIINKHGGTVWAEAEPGKGATFYFSLPGAV